MSRLNRWRNTPKNARFFIFDARAGVFFLLMFFFWSRITFYICVSAFCVFGVMERFGFTPEVFVRWLRSRLAGPIRQSTPWWRRTRHD
jgi:intracellular multiplication protein IcmT